MYKRYRGTIKTWSDEKGEGKVKSECFKKHISIDMASFNDLNYRPQAGDLISFTIDTREDGKPYAELAELVPPTLQGSHLKAPSAMPNIAREWRQNNIVMRPAQPSVAQHHTRHQHLRLALWLVLALSVCIICGTVGWETWQQRRQARLNKILVEEMAAKMIKENKGLEEQYRHAPAAVLPTSKH